MKKLALFIAVSMLALVTQAQNTDSGAESGLGSGIRFDLNEGDYQFKVSGMVQPALYYSKQDGQDAMLRLNTKRSYLNFSGRGINEKVSFFIQANFSSPTPLLDAYVAYHPTERWTISAGQRRTFTNNREMWYDEDKLQFTDRGLLSTQFSNSGREFGLFLEGKLGTQFVLVPQLAITSGDGINSFGTSSTDVDLGGFKYGGRLDVYPLGEFMKGNQGFTADLKHEESPKLLIGVAASLNRGASGSKGESHGDFMFFDNLKKRKLPDYTKVSADVLMKYKGISFLAEYMNASASNLAGTYLDSSAVPTLLRPGQISNYLVLGSAISVQAGYVTKSGYALDLRYETLDPEFKDQALSVLQQQSAMTVGFTKYFKDNNLKLQAAGSSRRYQSGANYLEAELMLQVVF